jgi:two-component system sensor histidine kinase/response regulator
MATIHDTTGTDCLLVVDDEETDIRVLGSMLEKLGFEILPATDGQTALKVLSVRRPDLILLDLLMPGMDGYEVCRRIQENPEWAEIPIIFLSAASDKNLVVRALEGGGVDFLTKPFSKAELISRVRTHLMLKTARDHAKRLAQDKDELLGVISHYLQNHLAGMQMSAQRLHERIQNADDPKLKLMVENIRSASSQMRAFVRAFLANAVADHGLVIKLDKVNLNDSVARVLKQYEDAARNKEILLRPPSLANGSVVLADSAALDQVLDNLVSNAIKFSPPGKEVSVSIQPSGGLLECRVQDHGVGFTEGDKARMFGRYVRLSARPTGGEPSTGLGLSIAKKLVRAMNGELNCESETGRGATFILKLPRAPSNPVAN